jgi:hypothetical protein
MGKVIKSLFFLIPFNLSAAQITCIHPGTYTDGTPIEGKIEYKLYYREFHIFPTYWGEFKTKTNTYCYFQMKKGYYEGYLTITSQEESLPTKTIKFIAQ